MRRQAIRADAFVWDGTLGGSGAYFSVDAHDHNCIEAPMRFLAAFLLSIALCAIPAVTAKQASPDPPGLREAQKQTSKPLEPPAAASPKNLDFAKLKQEADELARLSSAVPSDLGRVAQGQLQGLGREAEAHREASQAFAQRTFPLSPAILGQVDQRLERHQGRLAIMLTLQDAHLAT